MRKFIIAASVLLIITVLILAVVVNLNGIINSKKDFFVSKAERSLGRGVSIGEIGVTWRGGIGVRIKDFAIADDPSFSESNFIEAADLQINARLLPLLKKEFRIKSVVLHSPVIRVIRDRKGRFNIDSFGLPDAQGKPGEQKKASSDSLPLPIVIALFDIDGGELHFEDRGRRAHLKATQIDSHIENLDFNHPSEIAAKAAVMSQEQNLEFKGTFGPLSDRTAAAGIPVKASLNVSSLEAAEIRQAFPQLLEGRNISGRMDLQVGIDGKIGPGQLPYISGVLSSSSGSIADIDYTDLEAAFKVVGREAIVDSMVFHTLGGRVSSSGRATVGDEAPKFVLQSKVHGISLGDLTSIFPVFAKIPASGNMNLDINISGRGRQWNSVEHSLGGDGLSEISEGKFLGFNIADQIFQSITRYPGLSDLLSTRVREKYPKAFKSPDTEFRDWQSDFIIERGRLKIRNLVMNAFDYTLRGKGYIDFDLGIDLIVTLVASQALSTDIAREVREVKYLTNAEGKIEIPLHLGGNLPKVRVSPDQKYLQKALERALLQRGVETLKKKGLRDLFPFLKEQKNDSSSGDRY